MARNRQIVPLSADPRNPDVAFVLQHLATVPDGQRSRTIWRWCAERLRGATNAATPATGEPDELDALEELLDSL